MRKLFGLFIKFCLLLGSVFLLGLLLLWNGVFLNVPTYAKIKEFKLPVASEIYSSDSVLLGKIYQENRKYITLSEVPDTFILCLLATEDTRFFEHNGIDLIGLGRAFYKTILLSEQAGGGSTITQQLVKNRYPRNSFTYHNIYFHKVREWLTALKFENLYSKQQILQEYLNTVPFGHNSFGIYTGSKYYFGKTPNELQIHEMATLVGLLKGTTLYDPVRNPKNAVERRNLVLQNMHEAGFLSEAELAKFTETDLTLAKSKNEELPIAPFFLQHIRGKVFDILKDKNQFEAYQINPYTDGLTIYTTINSKIQHYAEMAVSQHLAQLQQKFNAEWTPIRWQEFESDLIKLINLKKYPGYQNLIDAITKGNLTVDEESLLNQIKSDLTQLHSGFTCIKNTGEVLAWVGGRNFQVLQYDHVKSKRQVGSVFKPIVYATAVDQGVNICNYFENKKQSYSDFDDWEPGNSSERYSGEYTMKGALTYSLNVISVKVLLRAGLSDVLNVAQQMGITSEIPEVPSISLGTPDISLFEMVNAYTCFPNNGKRVHTKYINSIQLPTGKEIYKDKPQKIKEVFAKNVAAIMTNMMESVVNWGTARPLRTTFNLTTPIAGKTGTTQNQADGWFVGFTPQITAGAWVGADNPGIHFQSIKQGSGAKTALPIWGLFVQHLQQDATYAPLLEGEFKSPTQRDLNCLNLPLYREPPQKAEVIDSPDL